MTKDKVSHYEQDPDLNSDLGNSGLQIAAYTDTGVKTLMAHLADMNAGVSPLDDTFTLANKADSTKQIRFDTNALAPATTVVLNAPSMSGTIALAENINSSDQLSSGFRNKVINGDFDVWQRSASQTSSGYGSADRWNNLHGGGASKTCSRESFTLGQSDVMGHPSYFLRTNVTTGTAGSSYCYAQQRLENVEALAGEIVTLTFYAKADANRELSVEFEKYFGSGGAPSPTETGIGVNKISLTTNWQRHSFVVQLPDNLGKTIGTIADNYLGLNFWFDAHSTLDARTGSLGAQSGIFDLSHISLVKGDASAELDPFSARHISQETALCQRYFIEGLRVGASGYANGINQLSRCLTSVTFPVRMRAVPTISNIFLIRGAVDSNIFSGQSSITEDGFYASPLSTATGPGYFIGSLKLDAEL